MKCGFHRHYWIGSFVLGGVGLALMIHGYAATGRTFVLGLTLMVVATVAFNVGHVVKRSRTLDEEWDSGYRAGYRCGVKSKGQTVVNLDERRRRARVSEAPLGIVAGHGTSAGRSTPH